MQIQSEVLGGITPFSAQSTTNKLSLIITHGHQLIDRYGTTSKLRGRYPLF